MSTEYPFTFDHEKAIETLLFVACNAPIADRFHICKILYFADRHHLEKYGRFIYGEHYVAMRNGPVPSRAYDLIKYADAGDIADLAVDDSNVMALREADVEIFSESEIEALQWAIKNFGSLGFLELRAISHDDTWNTVTEHGKLVQPPSTLRKVPIAFGHIIETVDGGASILDYIQEHY